MRDTSVSFTRTNAERKGPDLQMHVLVGVYFLLRRMCITIESFARESGCPHFSSRAAHTRASCRLASRLYTAHRNTCISTCVMCMVGSAEFGGLKRYTVLGVLVENGVIRVFGINVDCFDE